MSQTTLSTTPTFVYETPEYTLVQHYSHRFSSVTIYYRINTLNYLSTYLPGAFCVIQPDFFGNTHIYIDIPLQNTVWKLITSPTRGGSPLFNASPYWSVMSYTPSQENI